MKDFLNECNSYKGRWNRKKFWLYPLGLTLLILVPEFIILMLADNLGMNALSMAMGVVMLISYIYIIYVSVCSYIKRLRDLDKNPWMTLLMFVPIVSLFLAIYCGFWKGTVGPNKYGADPLGGEAKEATTPKVEL